MNMGDAVTVAVDKAALGPGLTFHVCVDYQDGREALLGVAGTLHAADGKRLAMLTEIGTTGQFELAASDGNGGGSVRRHIVSIVADLNERAVDHIEVLRSANKKGDVILELSLTIRTLQSNATIASVTLDPDARSQSGQNLVYKFTASRKLSGQADLWLLSGDGRATFARVHSEPRRCPVTIRGSDYAHDFAPVWHGHEFLVCEIPTPPELTGEDATIAAALAKAKESRKYLNAGEWDDAVRCLRGVWELLKKPGMLTTALTKDGCPEDAAKSLEASAQAQFTFASKFAHAADRSGNLNPEVHARKEDAYHVYSTAMTLLNLVARKANRQATR